MAVTKLGSAKSASGTLAYVEKKAEEKSGLNCDVEVAKEQFRATREIWGKNDGIQAHTIIQSFKPGEVTPAQANEIGRELAGRIAKGFEVGIFTHADKGHVHNHIVINSVNFETGKKYHSDREKFVEVKKTNDDICKEHGLSIADEKPAKVRHTLAEQALLEKGKESWKDEIRIAVNHEMKQVKSYEELKYNLQNKYDIMINDGRKHIVFTHPDNGLKVRGFRLGDDYTKEGLHRGIERQIGRDRTRESNIAGEYNTENSLNRDERGKSQADRRISEIRERVMSQTPAARRDAEEAQRRAIEADRIASQRAEGAQPNTVSTVRVQPRRASEIDESIYRRHSIPQQNTKQQERTINQRPQSIGFDR